LFCAFIEFRQAFDYVDHKCIRCKLIKCGIGGELLSVVRSINRLVKSRVMGFDGNVSAAFDFECILGVRQGEWLSPFLFALSRNGMEHELHVNGVDGICLGDLKLFTLLYADDIVIVSETEHGSRMAFRHHVWIQRKLEA